MNLKIYLLLIFFTFLSNYSFSQPSISSNATLDEVLAFIKSDIFISPDKNSMILETEDSIQAFATRKLEFSGCDITYVNSFKHLADIYNYHAGDYEDIKEYQFSFKDIKYVYSVFNGYIDNIFLKLNRKIKVHHIRKIYGTTGFDIMTEEDIIMIHYPMYLTTNIIQALNRAVELCGGKIEKP